MGNSSSSNPVIMNKKNQSQIPKYKCKYHSETEFDTIQLSTVLHRLIIDGYFRQYCSSLYIIPNSISIWCQNMLWGLNYFTIIINRNDLQTVTSPKQMNNNKNIDNNVNINRRDPKQYDMNTLYHNQTGAFYLCEIPFIYNLKSDGINYITLNISSNYKTNYRMIGQLSLYCPQTHDLIRFWDEGILKIDINKCKSFPLLHFICKINIFEMHQIVSNGACKTFYNNYIQIEEYNKYKYKFEENILPVLLMTKQKMNKYYLK
eukprot:463838_1